MRSSRERFSYAVKKSTATEHCSGIKRDEAQLCIVINPNKSSAIAEMGDRFATIDKGRKVGDCCALFRGGGWFPSNTMSTDPRPNPVSNGILIHLTVWPQYTNVTDRTERKMVP